MAPRSFLGNFLAQFQRGPQKGYAICTAPRSGSNYLCQLLTSTGKLGAPLEYFNGSSRRVLDDPTYPDAPRKQIAKIKTTGSSPNGIYGVKLFTYQHEQISANITWTDNLPDLHFISLIRHDLIGQAISWSRAKQTGQYRASQPVNRVPQYDADHILAQLDEIRHEYAAWETYFEKNSIRPLRLVYEQVQASPQSAVDSIAEYLRVDGPCRIELSRVTVERQSDSISAAWRTQFETDMANTGMIIRG